MAEPTNDTSARGRPGLLRLGTAAVAGALSWQAAEYSLHRWLMHEMRGRGMASKEHLKHHADVTYFAPTSKKLLTAVGVTAVALPAATAATGWRTAVSYNGGFIGAYAIYEWLHRRSHTHGPTTAYGRRMRKHHMHHHFGAPMRNHGVTFDWFDRLFGTYDELDKVTVPRRMAPVWLTDEAGEVRPEHAEDYEIRGRSARTPEVAQADHDAAFANQVPSMA